MNQNLSSCLVLVVAGGLLAACRTQDALAPATEEPAAAAAFAMGGTNLLNGDPLFSLGFDIDASDGMWSRILRVRVAVDPVVFEGGVDSRLRVRTVVRFLTTSGQLIATLDSRNDRINRQGIVSDVPITDAVWGLLVATKASALVVDARVDLLMEEEGKVKRLDKATGQALFDMLNASLIKSPRDSFMDDVTTLIDPGLWVREETNTVTGALDHLVVIAFELWTPIVDRAPSFRLAISGGFAVNGRRFAYIEQGPAPVVDAADYTLDVANHPLLDPAVDPVTGLPIVDVERVLVVRTLAIPDDTWKLVETAQATGTVTLAASLGLQMETASGPAIIDGVFLSGLAEPRPDPAWFAALPH